MVENDFVDAVIESNQCADRAAGTKSARPQSNRMGKLGVCR